MRNSNKLQDTISQTLANGIMVKGSYERAQNGAHLDLLVVATSGNVLGRYHTAIRGDQGDVQTALKNEVQTVAEVLKAYQVNTLVHEKVQRIAVEYVLRILQRKFRQAAAA
jgi:hypothetical protein